MSRRRISDDEVIEDSEPEREAQRQAVKAERKKLKLRQLATPSIIVLSDESPSPRAVQPEVIDISDSPEQATQPDDDTEIIPTLNLNKFVFKSAARPLQSRNSGSTIGSSSSSLQGKPAAARSSRKTVDGELLEADLKRLTKCVSCEMAWTTRKTPAQKGLHMRSCAKKNGLTIETLGFLVRKEVENTPAGTSKGKGKAPMTTTAPVTLLEETMQDAAPKRKTKRRDPIDILKPMSEIRGDIVDRARNVIARDTGTSVAPRTQAVGGHLAVSPPSTLAFGASRLGQNQGKSLFAEQESDDEPQRPPATQMFAPSKLVGTVRKTAWARESASDEDEHPKIPTTGPTYSRPKGLSPNTSPMMKRTRSPVADSSRLAPDVSESPAALDDDAYDHYEPSRHFDQVDIPVFSTTPAKRKTPTRNRHHQTTPSKARATTTTNRLRRKGEDLDEGMLLQKILGDKDLHLRILRYQAIDLDVFLALVLQPGEVANGRLKLQLRVFSRQAGH
ncbi:hypothetical protein MKEN_00082900 [Mycena kentingensis (nom. inval.)]|nr:hypothetical protein MKEN_00082900 [Mycena kentingensis (nom. inval.)]